jgi:endonuclease/exonuclease/phosphatase (EEP) superfamily protein YafD
MILFKKNKMAFRLASTLISITAVSGCAVFEKSVNDTVAGVRTNAQECSQQLVGSDPATGGELDSESIRLVNWNIQKGGDPRWTTDLTKLEGNPDLIILQEAPLKSDAWDFLSSDQHHSFSPGYRTRRSLTGVMTVSNVKPLTQCNLVSVEPWIRSPKASLITEYGLSNSDETLLVVNIHAVNFTFGIHDFHKQFKQTFSVLTEHEGPILVSGDFNTWHWRRTDVLEELTDALGLEMLGYDEDHRKRFMGQALDHIYVRGLEVLEATTLQADSSDHNPMSVLLRL